MKTQIERENKVVIRNSSACIVIVNGGTININATASPAECGIKFTGLTAFEAFIMDCQEVCKAARKELEYKP